MTTPTPDDWSDLARTWVDTSRSGPGLDPALIRTVLRRDRLARLNFVGEIAGAAVVIGVLVWALLARDLPWSIAVAALAFTGFAVAMTLWSRRGDPGVLTETPEAVLLSAIAQARHGRRWAWAGVANSVAAFAFVASMTMLDPSRGPSEALLIAITAGLAVCIGFYLRHARRCGDRMKIHSATLEALRDEPPIEP
ncbi:hypothetical protein [uncultured Brevundimonas sp.]|uniref:hypothetical protein n=1 Tax=uncultured Brevundimonas sp. TaxID=213418 RepID=UPI0030EC9885|tara:strand:- start:1610 stop:2194 length:585 start_codon:yes stop_codon:yes gene_type:complete